MIRKEEFIRRMEAAMNLIRTGKYQIAGKTMMDLGMEEEEIILFMQTFQEEGPPSRELLEEAYRSMDSRRLRKEKRPDVNLDEGMEGLKDLLDGEMDVNDFINNL